MGPELLAALAGKAFVALYGGGDAECVTLSGSAASARSEKGLLFVLVIGDVEEALLAFTHAVRQMGPPDACVLLETSSTSKVWLDTAAGPDELADAVAAAGTVVLRWSGSATPRRHVRRPPQRSGHLADVASRVASITEGMSGVSIAIFDDGVRAEYRGLQLLVGSASSGELLVGASERDREARLLSYGEGYDRRLEAQRCYESLLRHRVGEERRNPIATSDPSRWMRSSVLDDPTSFGFDRAVGLEVGSYRTARRRCHAVVEREGSSTLATFTAYPDPSAWLESLYVQERVERHETQLVVDLAESSGPSVLCVSDADKSMMSRVLPEYVAERFHILSLGGSWRDEMRVRR